MGIRRGGAYRRIQSGENPRDGAARPFGSRAVSRRQKSTKAPLMAAETMQIRADSSRFHPSQSKREDGGAGNQSGL